MSDESGLKQQLRDDLTTAMRARDELTLATLRLALTAITTEEVSGKSAHTLDDAAVRAVLAREVKRRREAATIYADNARPELADRENAEAEVLSAYLPTAMDDEELRALVAEAVGEVTQDGTTGPRAMGAVMKTLTPRIAGRAEGSRISAEVKRQLAL